MFTVLPSSDPHCWKQRPEFIVVRRITGDADDHDVAQKAMQHVAAESGLSVHIAPAEGLRGILTVVPNGSGYETFLNDGAGSALRWYTAELLPKAFFPDNQFVVAAGLSGGSARQKNWDTCLATVRALRLERPLVYAQFLSWKMAPARPEPVT